MWGKCGRSRCIDGCRSDMRNLSRSAHMSTVSSPFTRVGNPKRNLANTKQALGLMGITIRRDEFRDQIVLGGTSLPPNYHGTLTDRAATWLRNIVLNTYGFDPGDDHVHSAIKGLA